MLIRVLACVTNNWLLACWHLHITFRSLPCLAGYAFIYVKARLELCVIWLVAELSCQEMKCGTNENGDVYSLYIRVISTVCSKYKSHFSN